MNMDLTEKISYIKGYAEGLNLDQSKDEVKVINKIIDLLDDMAESVAELQDCYDESVDIIDAINEDLLELEEYVYDECDEDECHCDDCDCCDDDEENPMYEVTCPQCNEKIVVTEDELLYGEIDCPNCDTVLEFDFSDIMDDDHEDGCSCGCHDNEDLGKDDLMS